MSTDLKNLENSGNLECNSKSQGKCHKIPKVRENSGNFVVRSSFLANLRILISELFLGSIAPNLVNGVRLTVEPEKSWKSQVISSFLDGGKFYIFKCNDLSLTSFLNRFQRECENGIL